MFSFTEVVFGLLFIVFVFLASFQLDSNSCTATWEASGMKVQWGILKGCQIQQKDGTWIPAYNYRAVRES